MGSDLGLDCWPISHKKGARLIRVKRLCVQVCYESLSTSLLYVSSKGSADYMYVHLQYDINKNGMLLLKSTNEQKFSLLFQYFDQIKLT